MSFGFSPTQLYPEFVQEKQLPVNTQLGCDPRLEQDEHDSQFGVQLEQFEQLASSLHSLFNISTFQTALLISPNVSLYSSRVFRR